jgi:hypothetical protein
MIYASSWLGDVLEVVLGGLARALGWFIGEWVFQDVWHAVGTLLVGGSLALFIYLRTRKPGE